jgi:saccharopine dehydrogenase-like NADP-dependent oxidoreductase
MARTTGFTCTAVANLILDGNYKHHGISPPEYLGKHFKFIHDYLKERKVNYKKVIT